MRAVVELLVADESQIRLVDEGGGVERLAQEKPGQTRRGELPQLVVHEREQLRGGLTVTVVGGF